jgi:predicted metal-dependent hydrolase
VPDDDRRMADRDRDEAGRPRNTRPRDALGRPLPHGSRGVERIPDELDLSPVEFLAYAQDLLDRGLAFNAHEVLEAAWKSGPDDEKPLWQGLAQLAVGLTHVQRGNLDGAVAVLRRASARLDALPRPLPYSVDAAGLVERARSLIRDLESGVEIAAERLRPTLTSHV